MSVVQVLARSLRAGDHLSATDRRVVRVVTQGLYMRTPDDAPIEGRMFPTGYVEIVLDDGRGVRYWRSRTSIGVTR